MTLAQEIISLWRRGYSAVEIAAISAVGVHVVEGVLRRAGYNPNERQGER